MNLENTKLDPAQINEIEILASGFRTRCLVAGPEDGEVVLLLHDAAFGGSADVTWGQIIPGLATKYRVIAPDLLGFGGSDKVVFVDRSPYDFRNLHVISVLDALRVSAPVHLIGSSFGGSMGLHMLRGNADRLASVVSIAGAGGGWRTEFGRTVLGSWDGTRQGLKVIAATLADDSLSFNLEAHVDQRFQWATANGHYRAVMAAGIKVPAALLVRNERDPFPKVPDSDIPVLLIAGKRDELVEPDWPEKILPLLTGNTTVIRIDAKHSPNLEIARETLSILHDWLSTQSGGF